MKKRSKKARGAPQVAVEDDSDDELEVLPSNVQAYIRKQEFFIYRTT